MNTRKKLTTLVIIFIVQIVFPGIFHVQASRDRWHPVPGPSAQFYFRLGCYTQAAGNPYAALRFFSAAISIQPSMVEAYEARADTYVVLELYDRAIVDYTRALTLTPANRLIYAKRAFAYLASGNPDRARPDFEQSAKPMPVF